MLSNTNDHNLEDIHEWQAPLFNPSDSNGNFRQVESYPQFTSVSQQYPI